MAAPTPSDLDFSQCIQGAYDDANGRLRVDAAITAPLDVNGEVLVDVRASDGDSVLVYGTIDGTTGGPQQVLKVNPDGSINVDVITGSTTKIKSVFNQVTSVPSSVLTTILTYTVPIGKTDYIGFIETTGTNIAQFQVSINSTLNAIQRTYFGGELNTKFDYNFGSQAGYPLNAGDVVLVQVIHTRPVVGDFEARLIYAE